MQAHTVSTTAFANTRQALSRGARAAARLLQARAAAGRLRGSVRLLFQPAEEGGAGGAAMVEAGALAGAAGAHAIHVWPGLPSGTVATRVRMGPPMQCVRPSSSAPGWGCRLALRPCACLACIIVKPKVTAGVCLIFELRERCISWLAERVHPRHCTTGLAFSLEVHLVTAACVMIRHGFRMFRSSTERSMH